MQAQVQPGVLLEQQRRSDEQKQRQEQLTPPAPSPLAPPPRATPPLASGDETRVAVTRFTFTGHTVFSTQELEAVVAEAVGKDLTVRELSEVAARLSDYYLAHGYLLAQAYLPPQEIQGGVVTVAILEGAIGELTVTGNERYATATILRRLAPLRAGGGILREATLETALRDLNDYPGLTVRADLAPGATRGVADLRVTAVERRPHTLGLDVNNYGSSLTGPWLYGVTVGLGNLAGLGDQLTGRFTKSDDQAMAFTLGYRLPVTSVGTTLALTWQHSENVIGEQFALLRPVGRADVVSVDLLQSLRRTSAVNLTVFGGVEGKTIRNIFAVPGASGTLVSKDELRLVRLGLRGDARDAWLGRTYVGLTWHHGIEGVGGSNRNAPQTSFAGAGPGAWNKWTADVARYQSLALPVIQGLPVLPALLNDSYLIVRATGQVSDDRLLSPERFTLGGYYTVRGYPVAESIGDHGYAATAELVVPVPSAAPVPFSRRPWKEVVQVAAFLDHGATFVSPVTAAPAATPQVFLTGAGLGLRINVPVGMGEAVDEGRLALTLDWATAIGRPRPTSRDQGISLKNVYGDGAAGVLYVSASLRF